jgi:hypothetical protein
MNSSRTDSGSFTRSTALTLRSLATQALFDEMRSRLAKWLVVSALVLATGGHWAILQSVAWFGMFVNFSQTEPVIVALEKTFDGRHPCQLCKAVQAGKQSEKKQEMQKVETKLDFWLARNTAQLFPPPPFSVVSAQRESAPVRAESPPTPPPRLA